MPLTAPEALVVPVLPLFVFPAGEPGSSHGYEISPPLPRG